MGNDDGYTAFNYFPNGATTVYKCNFNIDDVPHSSGGGVTFTQMGKVGEYCAGSFSLEPAGYYSSAVGKQIGTAAIEGRIKLKRY